GARRTAGTRQRQPPALAALAAAARAVGGHAMRLRSRSVRRSRLDRQARDGEGQAGLRSRTGLTDSGSLVTLALAQCVKVYERHLPARDGLRHPRRLSAAEPCPAGVGCWGGSGVGAGRASGVGGAHVVSRQRDLVLGVQLLVARLAAQVLERANEGLVDEVPAELAADLPEHVARGGEPLVVEAG